MHDQKKKISINKDKMKNIQDGGEEKTGGRVGGSRGYAEVLFGSDKDG